MKLDNLFEGLRDPKDNPCWKGYKPVGTKKKAGKTVTNCVPAESTEQGVREGDSTPTFNLDRRQLNIPELIKRGAFYITHPHGPNGWETDRPDWDFSLITLQNILEKSPDWAVEYKKYVRPESYKKLTQDFINRISDEKYQQILWSIKKLGIPDNVAFLDKGQQGVAESGKTLSRDELERELADIDSMIGEAADKDKKDIFTYHGNDPELRKLKFKSRVQDPIATNDFEAMLKWLLKHHKTNASYLKHAEELNTEQEQEIDDIKQELVHQKAQDVKQQIAIKKVLDLVTKNQTVSAVAKETALGESFRRLNESSHYSYEGWRYETETDEEEDNIKIWHYAVRDGKRVMINYTPYAYLSPARFRNFIDNGHPEIWNRGALNDQEFDKTFPPVSLDESTDDEKAMLAYIQRLVDNNDDDAYDAIRDFEGMYGYRPSIYKASRPSYNASRAYQSTTKPKMTHLHYFTGVDDQTASAYKMKKDRNGKWYLPQYNTSGRGFDRTASDLIRSFGTPRTIKLKEQQMVKEADVKQGFENMKSVLKAIQSSSNTIIQLDDDEPMDIEYPFARFIGGFYKQAVKDGKQEEFLKKMSSASFLDYLKDYWMHKLTKASRNEI